MIHLIKHMHDIFMYILVLLEWFIFQLLLLRGNTIDFCTLAICSTRSKLFQNEQISTPKNYKNVSKKNQRNYKQMERYTLCTCYKTPYW